MFDLNKAIEAWRRSMVEGGVQAPEPLDELEGHLRDAVEGRVRSGLKELEAFTLASQELGLANDLKVEFDKVEVLKSPWGKAWGDRNAPRLLAGLNLFWIALWTPILLSSTDFTLNQRLLGFAALAAMPLAQLVVGMTASRLLPAFESRRLESAVIFTCVLSGITWFALFVNFQLPRYAFTPGKLRVAMLWAFIPGAASPMAFLGLRKTERQRQA